MSDQGRADTALMELRHHRQRTENLHFNQPPWSIEQTAGEHDMTHDLPVALGDQREAVLRRNSVPQSIHQVGHDKAMVTECLQVNIPHGLSVARKFFAKIHARRVKTLRVVRKQFWSRRDTRSADVCTARLHSPTLSYMVTTPSPSSVRFEPRVFERLSAFVAAHRDLTLSSATSRLVDEALRIREHPLITFKDGPAGRRARLVGGPDVWEVIGAIRSVREAEPALAGDEVLEVAAETSGTPVPFIRAALAYWSDYPEEVEDFLDRARAEAAQAQAAWERQQGLLGL